MTDATPTPQQVVDDPDAVSGDRDVDGLSEHHEHAIVNRRLDADLV